MKLKTKDSNTQNKMVIVIDEEKYNPERTITKSQKFIIFNHIDQYFKCCNPKDNNSFPLSPNLKIQSLPSSGKICVIIRY